MIPRRVPNGCVSPISLSSDRIVPAVLIPMWQIVWMVSLSCCKHEKQTSSALRIRTNNKVRQMVPLLCCPYSAKVPIANAVHLTTVFFLFGPMVIINKELSKQPTLRFFIKNQDSEQFN